MASFVGSLQIARLDHMLHFAQIVLKRMAARRRLVASSEMRPRAARALLRIKRAIFMAPQWVFCAFDAHQSHGANFMRLQRENESAVNSLSGATVVFRSARPIGFLELQMGEGRASAHRRFARIVEPQNRPAAVLGAFPSH